MESLADRNEFFLVRKMFGGNNTLVVGWVLVSVDLYLLIGEDRPASEAEIVSITLHFGEFEFSEEKFPLN